jgi:tellurite resistance protein TerB
VCALHVLIVESVVLDSLKRELARYRQRPFLDALMAGCAFVAAADGKVSLSERSRIDHIFESFRELDIFDPHEAVDSFNEFAEAMAENAEKGRRHALSAIDDQADEPARARLLLRACVAVSLADGNLSDIERAALADICNALALPAPVPDEVIAAFGAGRGRDGA